MKSLKNIFFILCSFSMLMITAQENDPGWLWAERGGSSSAMSWGSGFDRGRERIIDIVIDDNNNYYYLAEIAGYYFTLGGYDYNSGEYEFDTYNDSAGDRDIFVFSTDSEGNYRWSKTIGGGGRSCYLYKY